MKTWFQGRMHALPACLLGGWLAGSAAVVAEDIIGDDFNNTSSTYSASMTGRTPTLVNLPSGTWVLASGDGNYETYVRGSSSYPGSTSHPYSGQFHNIASSAITLGDGYDYVKPAQLDLAADLAFGNTTPTTRYVLLGFYSAISTTKTYNPQLNFTGLRLNTNGSLTLVQNGTASSTINWSGGTFTPTAFTRLSYSVDTSNGSIFNVGLAGSNATYAFSTTAFTDAATAYLGIGGRGDNSGIASGAVYVDNLSVGGGADPAESNPFGVACSAQQSGTANMAAWLPQVAGIGVKWTRLFPTWGSIENPKGTYNWSGVDVRLDLCEANGVKLIGILYLNSAWATPSGTLPTGTAQLADWYSYVNTLVAHCGDRVKYWEVWNEPPNFTGTSKDVDELYAATVTAAYHAVKAANPNCMVGLAAKSADVSFLRDVIVDGAADHYDFITLHPYEHLGQLRTESWEGPYLTVAKTVRTMLAAVNPGKANVPIIFTEVGTNLDTSGVTEASQAGDVVKAYSMALAQGVERVCWFEARDSVGDSGRGGLISSGTTHRQSFHAMHMLTTHFGARPAYQGWLLQNGTNYGFVFNNGSQNVMATWAPPGITNTVTFTGTVQVVNPLTEGVSTLNPGAGLVMTNTPMIIVGLPAALTTSAQNNKSLPFPWKGDYTGTNTVRLSFTSTGAVEEGLHMPGLSALPRVQVAGAWAVDMGTKAEPAFMLDRNFLAYTPVNGLQVSITLMRKTSTSAGFNFWYEASYDATRASQRYWENKKSPGWYTIPTGTTAWTTKVYTLTDDQFVGTFANEFSLGSDSTANSQYYLKEVKVVKP